HAADSAAELATIATPQLWAVTVAGIVALLALDFVITRKPHEVSFREALGWSAFYIALPVAFGAWVWAEHGSDVGVKYYTGYIVEKSLSVYNLFVFILFLSAFAVPRALQQRALLVGVIGALALRAVFIALRSAMIARWSWSLALFGAILLATAVKVLRDALSHEDAEINPDDVGIVRFLRRFWPVTGEYHGARYSVTENGRRALTPFALVVAAIMMTDVV